MRIRRTRRPAPRLRPPLHPSRPPPPPPQPPAITRSDALVLNMKEDLPPEAIPSRRLLGAIPSHHPRGSIPSRRLPRVHHTSSRLLGAAPSHHPPGSIPSHRLPRVHHTSSRLLVAAPSHHQPGSIPSCRLPRVSPRQRLPEAIPSRRVHGAIRSRWRPSREALESALLVIHRQELAAPSRQNPNLWNAAVQGRQLRAGIRLPPATRPALLGKVLDVPAAAAWPTKSRQKERRPAGGPPNVSCQAARSGWGWPPTPAAAAPGSVRCMWGSTAASTTTTGRPRRPSRSPTPRWPARRLTSSR